MGRNTDISSFYGVVAITPSDSSDIVGGQVRGFMIAADGDVAVIMADGSAATLAALKAGQIYPFQARRVNATGTTATGIVGLR